MGRYISVPTEIEAVQFDGSNFHEVRELVGYRPKSCTYRENVYAFQPIGTYLPSYGKPERVFGELWVDANQQWLPIEVGEWIVKDELGAYPCKDDVFKKKYREL